MVAPFDLTKLKNEHNKKRKVKDGFSNPVTWFDTGNYAVNKMISGDFKRGIPLGTVAVVAGESGSGKSYIVSGNIIRDALAQGCSVILLDTEDGVKDAWLRALGVDPDHENLLRWVKSTVNQIAEVITDMTSAYREEHFKTPLEEQPKVLFIVDSLGFVETDTSVEQFTNSELKGDKGIKAKALKMLVSNCIRLFAGYQLGLIATNHTYKSQDMYNPDDVISGGSGFVFASSIILSMNKKKLKIDEDGNKIKQVRGIVATVKCVKTRFAKPFEEVEVAIPYDSGMNPYSGVFDMALNKGRLKEKARKGYFEYTDRDGVVHERTRKTMDPAFYDMIIAEWDDSDSDDLSGLEDTDDVG